jgi:hypothetical protein
MRWTRFISRGDFGTNDRARRAPALGVSPITDSLGMVAVLPPVTWARRRRAACGSVSVHSAMPVALATETKSRASMAESWRSMAQYSILTMREMM